MSGKSLTARVLTGGVGVIGLFGQIYLQSWPAWAIAAGFWAGAVAVLVAFGWSTIFTPHFWGSPMGPYTLIVCGILLTIVGNTWLYAQSNAGATRGDASRRNGGSDQRLERLQHIIAEWKREDTTYLQIDRRPEVFAPEWIAYLKEMQATRTPYDFETLYRVSGRRLVGVKGPYKTQEIQYVVSGLERHGYLQTMPATDQQKVDSVLDNRIIKFTAKWDEEL